MLTLAVVALVSLASSANALVALRSTTPAGYPTPKPAAPYNNDYGAGLLDSIQSGKFSGGIATFFPQNGISGACGTVHQDSDFIVALETSTYANGAHCGRKVVLKDTKTGHTETAIVADECPTCINPQSLDLSSGLFNVFASESAGLFPVEWDFA